MVNVIYGGGTKEPSATHEIPIYPSAYTVQRQHILSIVANTYAFDRISYFSWISQIYPAVIAYRLQTFLRLFDLTVGRST